MTSHRVVPMPMVLCGNEVVLRALASGDAAALAIASAESRENYRYNPVPDGIDEANAYVQRALRQQAEGFRMPFAVLWRGRVVGTTSYSDFAPWEWDSTSRACR